MTAEPLRIKTLAQLRAVLGDGSGLVITDSANDLVFHPDPLGCTHVREGRFVTKVIENRERNGSYFAVASLSDARQTWPDIACCRSAACSAAFGAATGEGDVFEVEDQRFRRFLGAACGADVRPRKESPIGVEAILGNWRTTQRVALGDDAGVIVVGSWPAELKSQAEAVYGSEIGRAIVEMVEGSSDWTGEPAPHLAFNSAKLHQRFYLPCSLSLSEYVARWSRPESLREVRQHPAESVRPNLWPWLAEQGFVDADDPDNGRRIDEYMAALERRRSGAHIRPGIRLLRRCDATDDRTLRRDITAAVGELAGTLGEALPPEADLCRGWRATDIEAALDLASEDLRRILLAIASQPGIDLDGVVATLGDSSANRVRGSLSQFARIADTLGIVDPLDGNSSWPTEHSESFGEVGPNRYLMPPGAAKVIVDRLG